MNRSLLLLALMPFCALADNSFEAQEAKQQIDPDAPTFKRVVVYDNESFIVHGGKPTAITSSETGVTKRYRELRLLTRAYAFTVTVKKGKLMYGFPIQVQERVCGDLYIKESGLFWGDRETVMARHLVRDYIMYNANERSSVEEMETGPCVTRTESWRSVEHNHYLFSGRDSSYSIDNLSEEAKLRTKLGASFLGKLMEANKQNSAVTAISAQCTSINE